MNNTACSLFISDLHLCASRPQTTTLLLNFLVNDARGAKALYVLGDLFEYWAGDDDLEHPLHRSVCAAFKQLADSGTRIYLMHGNRDFLLGEAFAIACGASLLDDPHLTDLHGHRALLTHGDTLCTDDAAYQAFRRQVREPAWQETFLALPLATRKAQIEALRKRSESEKSMKAEAIMDVNAQAVNALLKAYDYPSLLIHGHTHRPAAHPIELDGHRATRWVLSDWHDTGDYLKCSADGCERIPLGP